MGFCIGHLAGELGYKSPMGTYSYLRVMSPNPNFTLVLLTFFFFYFRM